MALHDFTVRSIDGTPLDLSTLKGKKVMVVNTASECGFTPQYQHLQELYDAYHEQLEIIGFPCNDFGAQEPGTNHEVAAFCQRNYGVTFPMMEKIAVKGEEAHPLYQWLTTATGVEVVWNFQKFLVDEAGQVVRSVSPDVLPIDESIINWINNDTL